MKYIELVNFWNEEFTPHWSELSEEQKIAFAFDEGRRTGFLEIANMASQMSENERPYKQKRL